MAKRKRLERHARRKTRLAVRRSHGETRWVHPQRDVILFCLAGVLTLVLAAAPVRDSAWVVATLIAIVVISAIPLLSIGWVRNARTIRSRILKSIALISGICILTALYGWLVWPPRHRHRLTKVEEASFRTGLHGQRSSPLQPIQFACPSDDESDCIYASRLIPLFRDAGWKVSSQVQRTSLATPFEGVVLVQHSGSGKPIDPFDPKSGAYVPMTADVERIRRAFNNIGIEPNSSWGYEIPETQITIYVAPEREDERARTDLTRGLEQLEEVRKHPIIPH